MYVLPRIPVVTMEYHIDSLDICFGTQLVDFYGRNKYKNVHQPLCIDYPNVTSGIRELSAKTYIK